MRLRKGKAVEWEIHRKYRGGECDVWHSGTEREIRKLFREQYDNGMGDRGEGYIMVKLTYEAVSPPSSNATEKK